MAAGDINGGLGCTISIGTTASNQLSDTYVAMAKVVSIPPVGLAYDSFGFASLEDGFEQIFKTIGKGGSPSIGLGRKASDAGQAAAIVALASHLDYNFLITLNDSSETTGSHGTKIYFKAKVLSYQTGPFALGSIVMATVQLGINASTFQEVVAT